MRKTVSKPKKTYSFDSKTEFSGSPKAAPRTKRHFEKMKERDAMAINYQVRVSNFVKEMTIMPII